MLEFSAFYILVFLLSCILLRFFWVRKTKNTPPGPWGFPVVGHLPLLGDRPIKTFAKWREQYGDVFRIRMGGWNTVVVNGYEAIKEAAEKHDDSFSSRPAFTSQRILKECNGGLSLAFGPFNDIYLSQRKITATVLRHFTSTYCAFTEELLHEEAGILSTLLLDKAKHGPIDIREDIQHSVGSVIYQLLYGRGEDVSEKLKDIITEAKSFTKFTENGNPFDVMPWLEYCMPKKLTHFRTIMTDFISSRKDKIDKHIETFSKEKQSRDMVDSLISAEIESSGILTKSARSRLLGSVGDLQGAGFDTTNKSLLFLILYMCKYPDIQLKVHREIDHVIGGRNTVSLTDRKHLIYTEATILESMRVASIVPFGVPRSTRHETKLQGYDIDKDTVVFFNLHSVAYDKDFWVDPENFRPERFIDENNELDRKTCCRVIPFSLGRRRCVGEHLANMEIFLLYANILQKVSFLKPEGEILDDEPDKGLVYSPKPFRVLVKERI